MRSILPLIKRIGSDEDGRYEIDNFPHSQTAYAAYFQGCIRERNAGNKRPPNRSEKNIRHLSDPQSYFR